MSTTIDIRLCVHIAVIGVAASSTGALRAQDIGPPPTPAELVAVQPDYRKVYSRIGKPQELTLTPEQTRGLVKRLSDTVTQGKKRHGKLPLGITGAIYWDTADRPAMPVVGFYPDTPAVDVLREGDVIVGANGRLFVDGEDPRVPMGYAIYEAQSAELGGKLTLTILRDGRAMNVAIPLGVTPRYADNWPTDCPRSEQTLNTIVRYVIDHTKADGDVSGNHSADGSWWNLLLLTATGEDAAIEVVRRDLLRRVPEDATWQEIEQMIRTGEYPIGTEPGGKASWRLGIELIALSEYYLLTGDSSVLPIIAYQTHWLEGGQSPTSGSWCHGLNFGGYGEVNSAGLGCFLGLALASKTPVPMKGEALRKSIAFFGKFSDGGIPYGDHPPEVFRRSDNGRSGNAAIAFAVLGDRATAEAFARPTCYSYASREWGHAENCFSFAWGPIGASHAPHAEYRMFLDNQVWYYEIGRVPYEGGGLLRAMRKGTFNEPYPAAGVQGLFLAMPRRQLQILGAPESVFALKPPPRLEAAAEAYRLKRWDTLGKEIAAVLAKPADLIELSYATRINEAYQRLERNADYTLAQVRVNLADGHVAKAYYQLRSLRLLLGEDREDMAAMWAKLLDPEMAQTILKDARTYDKARMAERKQWTDPLEEPRK